jgi:diguanylate cyclase (GGDEF)-like protein
LLILVIFLFSTYVEFRRFDYLESSIFSTTAYFYGPFLLAAGLSILPLTGLECALLAAPIVMTVATSMLLWPEEFGPTSLSATLLRLILIVGISAIAGMSQLRFLIDLIGQSTQDGLTKALNRNFGATIIDAHYSLAVRKSRPLAVLFIDLDKFKLVNDRFGHEAGDAVLYEAARSILSTLRDQDALVRWGGEEFLVILPETDDVGAVAVIRRIASVGFGVRPDGIPITASVGLAERVGDKASNWADLVKLADERMFAAKSAGRNCYVDGRGPSASLIANSTSQAIARSSDDSPAHHVAIGLTARHQSPA